MRPPNIPLITVLSVLLLLSCLLGSATGLGPQQHRGARKDVRGNNLIEARNPLGKALADGYGPPPPYYTGEPVAPTDLTSHHSLEESTATETQTGASQAGVSSKSNVSSHYETVSYGSSSLSVSSALETGTAMITVGSSAKAGSTSGSKALSSVHLTASGSFLGTETSGVKASSISLGQVSTISNSPLTGTYPSAGTSSPGTETEFPSGSASSATVSVFFNETKMITESVSHTQAVLSAEVSGDFTTTELASRLESSVTKAGLTTTTTRMLNVTVTVAPSSSSGIASSLSSLTVPMTADETTTVTVIPQQNSSELSTEGLATDTDSAEGSTLGSLATESTKSVTIQSTLTKVAISESTQKSTRASSIPANGTVSFTTTTTTTTTTTAYFTTTIGVPASSSVLSNSSGISRTTIVASGDSSGAVTGDSSAIMASITVALSTIVTTSKAHTALNVTSPATSSPFSSVPTSVASASVDVSESNIATTSNQTSSETLFASTALPINVTSHSVTEPFVVTTVSDGSVITIFPGGIIPTGIATSMMSISVSTQYSTSGPSRFNSSMSIRRTSLSSQTDSWLDWPTSTLTTSHTSEVTLEVPSLAFPTSWLSIITAPMTPPSVSTTSTRGPSDGSTHGNVTVIKTTMTSTITSSLTPTSLSSSGNVTVAHTTSGYNFSKSVGSVKSTFSSRSTSLGISTVIISKQPTNFPFPTNTSLVWQSETSSASLSESDKTIGPKASDVTFSLTTAGFNSTTPYTNSTTVTASETYPSSNTDQTQSIITAGASGSRNTTRSAQWFTISTVQTTTRTGSDLVSGTQTLSDTAAATPQPPASLNVTLTTISDSTYSKTFTDVKITIIMPTSLTTSESVSLPTVSTSTAPFPLPSNTTLTGTSTSFPPSGTGPRFTITGTLGDFSTSSMTISPSIRTTYLTVNTTVAGITADTSASASGTNEPLFPVSNSTSLGTTSLSTIASWRPDPEPWTSWPTLSLTNEPGVSTWTVNSEIPQRTSYTRTTTKSLTSTLGEPNMSHSSIHNLSSATSGSTSYTRTTTLTLTTTLEEPSTSPSTNGNRSIATSESISYTRTTTIFRTTTMGGPGASSSALSSSSGGASLSTSYTRTTTLTLTTTLAEPPKSQVSGGTVTNSSVSTWANVTSGVAGFTSTETISLTTVTSSLSGTLATFLTTGSAKGVSTSLESSALAPIPVGNSTLSEASGRTSSGIDTSTGTHLLTSSAAAAAPCESTSTSSSTCTESVYDTPTHTAIPASTDCLTETNGPDLSLSYVSAVTAAENVSSTCNTTSSTVHWSNMTHTFGVKDTETSTYQPLTTLRTVTKAQTDGELGSTGDDYPTPTDRVPEDPNFPWGNDSPIHRHQNSSELGPGENDGDGDGGLSKRISWRPRWENVRDKLEGLWRGQTLKSED